MFVLRAQELINNLTFEIWLHFQYFIYIWWKIYKPMCTWHGILWCPLFHCDVHHWARCQLIPKSVTHLLWLSSTMLILLRLRDACVHHENKPSLVQIMASYLFGAISLSDANVRFLSPGSLGIYFSEIWIKIQQFSLTKIHLKMLSGGCRPSCLLLNVLIYHVYYAL